MKPKKTYQNYQHVDIHHKVQDIFPPQNLYFFLAESKLLQGCDGINYALATNGGSARQSTTQGSYADGYGPAECVIDGNREGMVNHTAHVENGCSDEVGGVLVFAGPFGWYKVIATVFRSLLVLFFVAIIYISFLSFFSKAAPCGKDVS